MQLKYDMNTDPSARTADHSTTSGKPTLVLGASLKPERHSNMAVEMLSSHGHTVYALGGRVGETHGIQVEKDGSVFQGKDVHTVTLYMNARRQQDYYDYIFSLQPERIIFNPGAENPELVELARQNGVEPVVACTLVMLSLKQF